MGAENSKDSGGKNFLLESFKDHDENINCMTVSEDQSLLITGSEDKTIRMWSTKTKKTECIGVMKGHTGHITCLATCDTFIISGSADTTIRKWDMASCECLDIYEGHQSKINRILCTNKWIFSTSKDKTAKMWKLDNMKAEDKKPLTFSGHSSVVFNLIYLPGDSEDSMHGDITPSGQLITSSFDHTARSWNLETGATLKVFKGHTAPISCMATDPPGIILYTGSADHTIKSWDILSGKLLATMEGHADKITCITVVNRLMFTGSADETAMCWVADIGDPIRSYKGHSNSIITLLHMEGILYTGSADSTIRAYDAKTSELLGFFTGHDSAVTGLKVVGPKLYSASYDSTLRVWDIRRLKKDGGDTSKNVELERHSDDLERYLDEHPNNIIESY